MDSGEFGRGQTGKARLAGALDSQRTSDRRKGRREDTKKSTGGKMKSQWKRMWIAVMMGVMLFALSAGSAAAQVSAVQVQFITLTASHAALGAPIKWELTFINTGTSSVKVGSNVVLVAPNATSYTLNATTPTLSAGQIKTVSGSFTSSTLTSLTGAFTLRGFSTDPSNGNVVTEVDIPVTISTVPVNGVYGSVGGRGPATANQGATVDYQTVTANLTTASTSLKTNVTLVKPDGTTVVLTKGSLQTVAAGASVMTAGWVQPTEWTNLTGTFLVNVAVSDSSNRIMSTDTFTLTRNMPSMDMVPMFEDMGMMAGLNYDRMGMMSMPNCGPFPDQMMGGSGAAVGDYDGDGLDDIFVTDMAMGMNQLWHNNGDGTFTDMAMSAGIPLDMEGMMASAGNFADVDNDGHPDLLILYNEMMTMLLHNNGDGTFTDITMTSGLNSNPVPQNNMAASFGDYDGDGFLDVYVAAHADCTASNQNDHLYHNNGNNTFTDVTSLLGGSTASQLNGRGLAVSFVDLNGDGRPDIYVGNDQGFQPFSHPNVLWKNGGSDGKGGWIFTDISSTSKTNVAIATMGLAFTDYDRTGKFDIVSSNNGTNVMLKQGANGVFAQQQWDTPGGSHIARNGVPNPKVGSVGTVNQITWSTGSYDFNNDGWEDIWMAGGNIAGGMAMYPNALFINNMDGTFLELEGPAMAMPMMGMSMPTALFLDYNNDGWMDVFQQGMMGMPSLFMNNSMMMGNMNNWLEVKLVGTTSNKDAVGAKITATVMGENMLRQVLNGGTYQGNSTLVQHFGLGMATQVDTLTITWPSGKVNTYTNVPANQKVMYTEF
jgi:hypothetical protein